MRQFNNYEAVKVNSEKEATEFLKYLADNTDLRWRNGEEPTDIRPELNRQGFPIFIEVCEGKMHTLKSEHNLEDETKIIPLSEFIKPYTREQAEKVFEDYNIFHNNIRALSKQAVEFLNHKFPKSKLEQVTEAVKDLGDFKIEQTSTGSILIIPINKQNK